MAKKDVDEVARWLENALMRPHAPDYDIENAFEQNGKIVVILTPSE